MGKRQRLQKPSESPPEQESPRPIDSVTETDYSNDFNSENSPDSVTITYTKLELQETREDGIQVFTQYELKRDQAFQPGNKVEGYKPPTERKLIYFIKLHGLKERGEVLDELIEKIKVREQRRLESDNTILTMQSGLKVGLDEECIRQFCEDNDLNPQGTITRSELRRIVLQRRKMNALQYGVGLRLLRIPIEGGKMNS